MPHAPHRAINCNPYCETLYEYHNRAERMVASGRYDGKVTLVMGAGSELGALRFEMADIQAMMADVGIDTADHAVRDLLDDLNARHPYFITHGTYRHQVEAQQRETLAAFDRIATRP